MGDAGKEEAGEEGQSLGKRVCTRSEDGMQWDESIGVEGSRKS